MSSVISSVLGSLSIVCWIIVFTPQIVENWKRKSGESLSLTFLWIWLIGDIFNVIGAIMENLLPTVILLGIYFALADLIIIFQVYYYRRMNELNPELEPLLSRERETEEEEQPEENENNIMAVTVLILYGLFILFLIQTELVNNFSLSQYLGWVSAILYIGSRIPQILKNAQLGSVDGLSFWMFLFAVSGNILYCWSILSASDAREYIMINLPWLIGAIGTTVLDCVIFLQFCYYFRQVDEIFG